MPVTHAHPAAVIPLIIYGRRVFSASALVIGSMAPDFPYFFFSSLERKETHNLSGIFLYRLPMGLVVYALYQWLLRPALLDYFSQREFTSIAAPDELSLSRWHSLLIIVLSLIVGAATHNIWDAFTHATGWVPEHYPVFTERIGPIRNLPLYRILQYLSGVAGTLIVLWFFIRTLIRHQLIRWEDRAWRRRFIIRTLFLLTVAALLGALAGSFYVNWRGHLSSSPRHLQLLRYWIISSTDFVLILGLLRGLQLRWRLKSSPA